MTNDFKKTTLDYLTGNLDLETQKSNSFRDFSIIENDLVQKINDAGISLDSTIIKTLTTTTTSNYLMYGNGFIVVLDQDGNVLKVITEYNSGTSIGDLKVLNCDDDGNIYGIDMINSRYRIILLNNVALKTSQGYVCKLRNSYYIPDTDFKILSFLASGPFIKKDPSNNSTYYIVGMDFGNTSYLEMIKFTINVGSTNTWDYFQGTSLGSTILFSCDFILQQIGDTIVADVYYITYSKKNILRHDYFDGSTLSNVENISMPEDILEFRAKDKLTVYTTSRIDNGDDIYTVSFYEVLNGAITNLSQKTVNMELPNYQLAIVDNIVFTKLSSFTSSSLYDVQCGIYNGNEIIESDFITTEVGDYIISMPCTIQKTFSLYKFLIQSSTMLYRPSIVIYDSSYSGESFTDYNSLVALHGELYSGDNIIFARTLYNKSTLNNTTTSVLEVPFNYLNDMQITTQNLLSATQMPLVNNINSISKNIYENLFINFVNTITVEDEDTGEIYQDVANYINNSINTGTQEDYEGIQIRKVHINTNDQTVIQTISWDNIDDTHLETQFTIYVDSSPISIEFMNADESYTYLTKDISELEVGNYYTISQKIRME